MTLDDLELVYRRRTVATVFKYLNLHNSGCIQRRDVMFSAKVGFSGSADLMVQLSNFKNHCLR